MQRIFLSTFAPVEALPRLPIALPESLALAPRLGPQTAVFSEAELDLWYYVTAGMDLFLLFFCGWIVLSALAGSLALA